MIYMSYDGKVTDMILIHKWIISGQLLTLLIRTGKIGQSMKEAIINNLQRFLERFMPTEPEYLDKLPEQLDPAKIYGFCVPCGHPHTRIRGMYPAEEDPIGFGKIIAAHKTEEGFSRVKNALHTHWEATGTTCKGTTIPDRGRLEAELSRIKKKPWG